MLFYPRSPCGERLGRVNSMLTLIQFSIHALLAESDYCPANWFDLWGWVFLSTLSLRRATLAAWQSNYLCRIFYPRSPCGERHMCPIISTIIPIFLSTLSLRRATLIILTALLIPPIFLSTLSLRRATSRQATVHTWKKVFLSTLSLRRATRTVNV